MGQLVKSLISSRTRDEDSVAAYRSLRDRFGSAREIAAADPPQVEAAIARVTFADVKAARLVEALGAIRAERPDMDLGFLAGLPLADALAMAAAHPARFLGLDGRRGHIRPGHAADLVRLTPALDVVATAIGGQWSEPAAG